MRLTALALTLVLGSTLSAQAPAPAEATVPAPSSDFREAVKPAAAALIKKHGAAQQERIITGIGQVARFWRKEDGDAKAFTAFVNTHFLTEPKAIDALFERMEFVLESLDGHFLEIGRDLRWHTELELGPLYAFDEVLGGYDPGAHFIDDAFSSKLAFVVLLNFPLSTLEERQKAGEGWTRRQWAEARLVDRFSKRVPAEVNAALADARAEADRYIASYNIWMHHLLDAKGKRPFPPKLRLLSHWNLRDEIKAQYAQADGLSRQRMVQKVMEAIVTQTIPASVIDNPFADWQVGSNLVTPAEVQDHELPMPEKVAVQNDPEPDTRYAVLLKTFHAARKLDPFSPAAPTHIARSFNEDRQLPEARVKALLEQVCGSPMVKEVAALIEAKLGRKLEPFDIWYNGFRPGSGLDQAKLDALTRSRYPDAAAYKKDMPNLLKKLGFSKETADFLASKIEVDPARGSGHAMGAARRADNAHLRTRLGKEGMDYKGFNIAVHEMGHNVEQVFGLNRIDHTLLQGVPNTAFTEAMAFTFQARDLELLGQPGPSPEEKATATLNDFWGTFEIAGVGLVDMAVWHWMYEHPEATPAQLKAAVLQIAKDTWNRFYAPVFGQKDCVLLGVYSHMIHSFLYLPDYSLGHLIAHQVGEHLEKSGKFGEEIERMCRIGRVTPDLWMKQATGKPVSAEPMLEATEKALKAVKKK